MSLHVFATENALVFATRVSHEIQVMVTLVIIMQWDAMGCLSLLDCFVDFCYWLKGYEVKQKKRTETESGFCENMWHLCFIEETSENPMWQPTVHPAFLSTFQKLRPAVPANAPWF